MIRKICPRGQDLAGLIRYLYGPGRREEHTDPHIIAGYRPPPDLEPPLRANGSRDFRRLAGLLRLPHDVLSKWGYARPVWHCSMRAAPEDRMLSDREWAQIAEDVMHRTGLCPRGEEDEAVRWIATRHGPDHIHLVAMLARQDRTRPRIVNAARPPSRAETGKAARHGRSEPPRTTLRRHVATAAAAASSAAEFFARLDQAGIVVRLRYSVTNPGQVTGYAVALPEDSTRNGEPVWYGGGKLAADLSWPRLAQRRVRPGRRPVGLRRPHRRRRHRPDTVLHRHRQPGSRHRVRGHRTRCTWRPPRSAAAPCARPPTRSSVPPASPTGASRRPPRPGTSSATPPGSSPPTPTSPKNAGSLRCPEASGQSIQ